MCRYTLQTDQSSFPHYDKVLFDMRQYLQIRIRKIHGIIFNIIVYRNVLG